MEKGKAETQSLQEICLEAKEKGQLRIQGLNGTFSSRVNA